MIAWLKSNGFEVKLVTHRNTHGISQIGVSCGIVGTYVLVELKKGEDRDGFEFDFMNHDLGTTPVDGSTVFAGLQCLVNHELDFAPTGVALELCTRRPREHRIWREKLVLEVCEIGREKEHENSTR